MFSSFRTCVLYLFALLPFILFEIFSFFHKILPHLNTLKNLQTFCQPTLHLYCFYIVSATDFIQTLNKTEDFELFFLYSHFFAIFYHFRDITVLVLCHFCSSSDFRMGVYCEIFSRLEWVMSLLEWRSSEMWFKKSQKQPSVNPTTVGSFVRTLVI